jgi:predicted dehydrogenase
LVILVVGAGSIGRRHAANLERLGQRVELVPWRAFDRAAAGRRSDVSGLVIATATDIRLPLVELAAEKDWPFYAEKPLAFRPEDVARLYDLAAPLAGRSMIGFMMRYHPAFRALAESDLSDVYDFRFEIGHDVRQWRENWRFLESYAARADGGGVLLDLCHEIDMAAALFPGLTVSGVDCLGHERVPGVDMATRISLSRSGGPIGTVSMDYLAPEGARLGRLNGTTARRDIDFLTPRIDVPGRAPQVFDFDRNDMFLAAMQDFLALADGRPTVGGSFTPRLLTMRESADLVAAAWTERHFRGSVRFDLD